MAINSNVEWYIGLSDEELQAAREIFEAVDADGSGKIDVDELKEALSQSGRDTSDEDVCPFAYSHLSFHFYWFYYFIFIFTLLFFSLLFSRYFFF